MLDKKFPTKKFVLKLAFNAEAILAKSCQTFNLRGSALSDKYYDIYSDSSVLCKTFLIELRIVLRLYEAVSTNDIEKIKLYRLVQSITK